jgi:hypothetical protein
MKRGVQLWGWLNQVKADRRLCTSDVKIAIQLTQRTNKAAFARTAALQTWQGVALLATETGFDARTVQRAVRRLQAFGHVAVDFGGGRHKSNCCTLIIRPVGEAKTPALVPPFIDQNSGSGAGVFNEKSPAFPSANPGIPVPKPRQRRRPNLLKNDYETSGAQSADNEPGRALRQRAVALGARTHRQGGLGEFGAELRHRIGGANFDSWVADGKVELVTVTANAVTIAVPSKFIAAEIVNRFERQILEAARVQQLNVLVQPSPKTAP